MVPCGKNGLEIKVGDEFIPIKNLEEFDYQVESNIETKKVYDLGGRDRALKTGVSYKCTCKCLREIGDPGHESIVATTHVMGEEANRDFKINWADGATTEFTGVVDVTNLGTGTVTDIATLEFEVTIDGIPVETPAPGTGE